MVAKKMSKRCTIEQYATALAQHFVHTYPRVGTVCEECSKQSHSLLPNLRSQCHSVDILSR